MIAMPQKEEIKRFFKFAVTGGLNTAVDWAVFTLLTSFTFISIYAAQVISYTAGMLNSYAINRSWTFQTKEGFLSAQMIRFAMANLFVMAVSLVVIYIINSQFGFSRQLAKLGSLAVTVPLGFVVSRLWVFK